MGAVFELSVPSSAEKSPRFMAGVGTVEFEAKPLRSRVSSHEKSQNVRSFAIGPLSTAPNVLRF